MKVLYITYNGVGESIFQSQCLPYLKGLCNKGHKITLLSYERNASETLKHKELLEALGIRWYRLGYHKWPRTLASAYDFALGSILSFFVSLVHKVDIIHARATHGALVGILSARILKKKLIFDTRGLDSEEYVDGGLIRENSVLHKLLFGLEKFLFARSDVIVLLAHKAEDLLKEKGLDQYIKSGSTYVIPCVTDLELFKGGRVKKFDMHSGIRLTYVGSIGTWYMLDEMLEFFVAVKEKLTGSTFCIYTQSEKDAIYNKARKLNMYDAVKVEYVPHNSVPQYLAGADAGICFIKPVSSKRASSPTKIGEYMACGLPVVINPGIGDTEGIVRNSDTGVVIGGFSRMDYNKAVLELEALLRGSNIVHRCRETAEKYFSLGEATNTYDMIYRQL